MKSAIERIQEGSTFVRFTSGDENNYFCGSYWLHPKGGIVQSEDRFTVDTINELIVQCLFEKGKVSDGYHTFDELYDHRCLLFIALCNLQPDNCHKTWKNLEEDKWEGWFILQLNHPISGQISYHIPEKYWELCRVKEVEFNFNYDGHNSNDTLKRLKNL